MHTDKNLILRITEFAVSNSPFIYNEMAEALKINEYEEGFIYRNILKGEHGSNDNPHHILAVTGRSEPENHDWRTHVYELLPAAFYNYVDYLEIVEARKSAQTAKTLSWIAIWITVCLGITQIFLAYLQLGRT